MKAGILKYNFSVKSEGEFEFFFLEILRMVYEKEISYRIYHIIGYLFNNRTLNL